MRQPWGSPQGSDTAKRDLVDAVRQTVQQANPDLPEVAHWTLAAEIMNAVNWPDLAMLALNNAERVSPNALKAPAAPQLARTRPWHPLEHVTCRQLPETGHLPA